MKRLILIAILGGTVSGCAAKLDLETTDFLASRLPTNPQVEVQNKPYSSVTAGYEPRRAIEPEPWTPSDETPPTNGGNS